MSVFDYLDQEPGQPRMSDLWEWARDDYFAGESADVVCERHKLSRSQFFERARREGWLRRDQPRRSAEPAYDTEAEDAAVEDALDRPPPSAYSLARRAWALAERAILMGRRVEAAGWTRLARDLRKLAYEEAGAASWKTVVKANEPDSPDSVPKCATWADLPPASPAQTRPRRTPQEDDPEPPSASGAASTWAPAGAGEAGDEKGGPDSPDSLSPRSPAPLNRQDRRRLAKLGARRVVEKPKAGFRGVDAMG